MRLIRRVLTIGLPALCLTASLAAPPAQASSVLARTVVELIDLSEEILSGEVIAVSDGFDAAGVPFTEITVAVDDVLKGQVGETYTFRQFGLTAPRQMPDGTTYLGVSPDGWPRFKQNERVMLFMYKPASQTGLRTTVGLFQGKFTEVNGVLENEYKNIGLFKNVRVDAELTPAESKLLGSEGGVDPAAFKTFVRKTVKNRWIETGRVTRAN